MTKPDLPDARERHVAEAVQDMRRMLADFPDIEDQHEILRRLEAYVAMVERSMLPELEARQ
jgi:hypothetical protein